MKNLDNTPLQPQNSQNDNRARKRFFPPSATLLPPLHRSSLSRLPKSPQSNHPFFSFAAQIQTQTQAHLSLLTLSPTRRRDTTVKGVLFTYQLVLQISLLSGQKSVPPSSRFLPQALSPSRKLKNILGQYLIPKLRLFAPQAHTQKKKRTRGPPIFLALNCFQFSIRNKHISPGEVCFGMIPRHTFLQPPVYQTIHSSLPRIFQENEDFMGVC